MTPIKTPIFLFALSHKLSYDFAYDSHSDSDNWKPAFTVVQTTCYKRINQNLSTERLKLRNFQ